MDEKENVFTLEREPKAPVAEEIPAAEEAPVAEEAPGAEAVITEDAPEAEEETAEEAEEVPVEEPEMPEKIAQAFADLEEEPAAEKQPGKLHKVLRMVGRVLAVLGVTVAFLLVMVYGAGFVLTKGPSEQMRNLFVMTMRETSAMKWVANIYLDAETIAAMESAGEEEELAEMDENLVQLGEGSDAYGLVDEDGDGIILETVKGTGYVGYMMVVEDPTRIMMGTPKKWGSRGLKVEEMVETYDCIAGINGGGFEDPNGYGRGGTPNSMIVKDGKPDFYVQNRKYEFVGFDDKAVLHTGKFTAEDVVERNIQFGCSFGPVLLVNGEYVEYTGFSGVNPRTAIGQRADGAVLLLVVDGRQAYSLGATYEDLAQIMLDYGAVNACNLDGGSSTVMWYNNEYVNQCMTFVGIRPIPTGFLVKKAGA